MDCHTTGGKCGISELMDVMCGLLTSPGNLVRLALQGHLATNLSKVVRAVEWSPSKTTQHKSAELPADPTRQDTCVRVSPYLVPEGLEPVLRTGLRLLLLLFVID